jgi:hypothetical protein
MTNSPLAGFGAIESIIDFNSESNRQYWPCPSNWNDEKWNLKWNCTDAASAFSEEISAV